jgi:segregation and condensation protein B
MKDLIESCLFVSSEPVTSAELSKIFETDPLEMESLLSVLLNEYEMRGGGVRIVRMAGGYQMTTRPDLSADIARFLAGPSGKGRLSKPALETAAIVAYRQPVTIAEIESIRGVSSDGVVHALLDRRLIKEAGRKQTPGRPILYATTDDFLCYFGLDKLDDLPPLDSQDDESDEQSRKSIEAAIGMEMIEKLDDGEREEKGVLVS